MRNALADTPQRVDLKRSRVRTVTAFFMIYILVSGGAFGIEDMVSSSGPGLTLLLLVLLPLFWGLPMALVASELGSAIPGEGGFYVWTRRALGNFWGFQAAWWWSLSVFVDSSVYIVLTVSYLQHWLGFDQLTFYLICWSIIALFALVNIVGIRLVAFSSTVFSLIVLAPFVALIVAGLAQWQFNPLSPFAVPNAPLFGTEGVLALGLAIGVWMYSGFESISTLSGEIRNPQKIIPRALMLVMPFVVVMYVLPTLASLAAFGNWERFAVDSGEGTVSFVDIGRTLGGSPLAAAMMASALLGNLALYLDYLAAGARPLFALASDGLFPRSVARVSSRFGTPAAAIILMAAVNAVLVIGPFRNLVVIDVMLFISAYVLIFISAVRLRIKQPGLKRPFRIPVGTGGLIAMVTAPVLIALLTLYLNAVDRSEVLFGSDGFQAFGIDIGWMGIAGFVALASGPVLYPILRAIYGGPGTPPDEAGNHDIALAEAEARE